MLTWPSRDYRNRVDSAVQPPPKVLSNAADGRGMVQVTYSLPGLRRAVVSVPEDRWQAGGHAPVGKALARALAQLDAQNARIAGRVPEA